MAKKKPTSDDLAAFSSQPNQHARPEPSSRANAAAPPTARPAAAVSPGDDPVTTLSALVRDLTDKLTESQRLLVASAEHEAAVREEIAGLRAQLDAERDLRRQVETELDRERRRVERLLERERELERRSAGSERAD